MAKDLKSLLRDLITRLSNPWMDEQPAWLGDENEVVLTDIAGVYNARLINGDVEKVYNQARVSPDYDVLVKIGRDKDMPGVWQIIATREAYTTPVTAGRIEYHHLQHEFNQPDMVLVDRRQILYLTALVLNSASWTIQVYGGVILAGDAYVLVEHQPFDLSGYVVTVGAVFINIEANEDGTLSTQTGVNFGAPEAVDTSYIPVPGEGKQLIVSVLMYEGQTLSNKDIFVPSPVERGDVGAQIYSALTKTSLDNADLFGIWDSVSGRLRSISWVNFKLNANGITHVHGLMRWNGAIGQTTFELPDVASLVETISMNGLEEDPLVYSLSGDGTQIVLSNALTSADTVMAHYILAEIGA